MEFITDVSLCIAEARFKDLAGLQKILQPYNKKKKGSCYTVRGTFSETDKLVARLSALRTQSSPEIHRWTTQEGRQESAGLRSVDVLRSVMDYMKQRCYKQLDDITGTRFSIQTEPTGSSSSVRVTFKPCHASVTAVHADFIRQRFITFYQRIASDLQTTSVSPPSPQHLTNLQDRFPQLLFQQNHHNQEVTVSGHFVHIAKLKEFLSPSGALSSRTRPLSGNRSSRSPENRPLSETRSSRTSGLELSKGPEGKETCAICMESIRSSEKETLKCKHSFCRDCLKMAFHYKPVCPTCGAVYGLLTGTQPEGGTMRETKRSSSLPGYEGHGTLVIHYHIPSGIQKEEHPNPGQPYEGISRTAYLPDSSEGRQVLKLLQRAFRQRLVFTVGRSTTSGRNNTVTWNDIHHKTSTHGGATQYGYPDPDYLSRVRDELRVKGIE
ncbi:E3 ubiquitin-protein ligase DTX3L [Halichoeres trimaculatus]|uniref:E3 ubiquitin-protein ligase DTX3L n=1 Tax=Halichoeres trimaculatus TaxID=147232 RepID=UPI003D9F010A